MQIIDYPIAPESSGIADAVIRSIKPTSEARAVIDKAVANVDRLMEHVTNFEPDRHGRTSKLHLLADAAERAFVENPTHENAEALHAAIVRAETAVQSFPRIDGVIHHHLREASKKAFPACAEIIDQAASELDKQHKGAKASLAKNSTVFADVASIDRQHALAVDELAGERSAAEADPLGWLRSKGFLTA
jgi:uncharacterized protein GlcG (DUF336 family)